MATISRYISDFCIAGMRYWDGAFVLDKLSVGKQLRLEPESDNGIDPNAVALYYKKTKLGYIPREKNALPAQLLHFGHKDILECRIIKIDSRAEPWQQVRVGLYLTDKNEFLDSAYSGDDAPIAGILDVKHKSTDE